MRKYIIVLVIVGILAPDAIGQSCDTIKADYSQGFELFPLGAMIGDTIDCWYNENSTNPRWTVEDLTTVTSQTGPDSSHSGVQYIYLETSTPAAAGQADTLTSPSIDVSSLSSVQLSFYYHMYGQSMGSLRFEGSGDGGITWDSLGIIIGEQHTSSSQAWTEKVVVLPYQDSVLIRFIGVRGINFYSDMAIDDVLITSASSCAAPTVLSLYERTDTSATLSWIAGGLESDWIVSYGGLGSDPELGIMYAVEDTFFMINGISGQYDAYVQSVCVGGDSSSWFGPISWITAPTNYKCSNAMAVACGSAIVDSNWNSVENNDLISCITDPGTFGLWYTYLGDGHQVSLSTDDSVTNFDTKINVYTGSCNGLICETGNDDGGANSTSVVSFPSKTNNPYYIYISGFDANQGVFQLAVSCDDCFDPTDAIVSEIHTDSALVSWTSPIGSTGFVLEYGETGFALGSGNQITTGNAGGPITISSLMQSTAYEVYIMESCDGFNMDTLGPISFTTLCRFNVPYEEEFFTYKPTCWDEADFGSPQTGPVGLGASSWGNDFWLNDMSHPNGNCARINIFFIHSDWLISPVFNVTDSNYALNCHIASTEYNDSIPANWTSGDTLQLLYTDNGGFDWFVIQTWDSLAPPSHDGDTIIFPIIIDKDLIQFAFWASSGGIDSPADLEIFIDNFEIKQRKDIAPEANCQDITLYLDNCGMAATTSSAIDNGSIGELSISQSIYSCDDLGENAVTLYAMTEVSSDSCIALVSVVDTFAPSISCADTILILDSNQIAVISPVNWLLGIFDNCEIDSVYLSQDTFTSADMGSTLDTLYAIDVDGNQSMCVFEVRVEVCPSPCCPLLVFTNNQVQGTYHADTIRSSAFVHSPDIVTFKVASCCDLNSEFEVELGSEFEVIIEDCE